MWHFTGTNSAAALQAPGGVGVRAYLASAITNGPVVFSVDDFSATNIVSGP